MRQDVKDIIIKYGSQIICTEAFRETFDQTHHYRTTLGDHTLGVTVEAVKFCLRHGMTDEETLSNVVVSCLCHDLGLMGREEKYQNNLETLIRHPKQSAEVYMDLSGEENDRVLNSIRSHMFPLKTPVPRYKESWVLVLADKIGASLETLASPALTVEEREELLRESERSIS